MTAAATAAAGLTPLPPKDAIRFFEKKGLKPGFAWQDVWEDEHAHEFTIAKMMQVDLLADVQASLTKTLADGQNFDVWKKTVQPMLESRGWWGRSEMTDPLTGEVKSAQLGSPRRLRVIYDTNMRTARAAGAWDRIQERKAERPYLRYVAVLDEQTRADHRAYHGVILPVDHPWWRTHYPPNGWKCRCTVQQLSARDLERFGWKVSDAPPEEPLIKYVNPRTGDEQMIPAGIDPGFANNVGTAGRVAQSYRLLAEKLTAAPPEIARRAGWSMLKTAAFERFLATAAKGDAENWWPLPAPAGLADVLGVKSEIIRLSADTMAKQRGETDRSLGHAELTPEEYRLLPEILADGEDFRSKNSPLARARVREIGGRRYIAVVKATNDCREIYLTSFRHLNDRAYAIIRRKGMAAAAQDGVF